MILDWDCGTATLVQLKVQFALLGISLHAIAAITYYYVVVDSGRKKTFKVPLA